MATLADVLSALQNAVTAVNSVAQAVNRQVPSYTSGLLTATALVQSGFVRVTGVSVVVAGVAGTLNDASNMATATAANAIFTVPAVAAFYPLNMVCMNGLVYTLGTGQKVVVYYTRV
jgi:hypothetical protein